MLLDSWTNAEKGSFESAEVFAKPPFRSKQFLAATVVVLLSEVLDMLVLVRLSGRLSFVATAFVCFVFIITLGNWLRVTIVHRRLHELYLSTRAEGLSSGAPLNVALRAASTLSYWGTLAAAVTGSVALMALIQFVRDKT